MSAPAPDSSTAAARRFPRDRIARLERALAATYAHASAVRPIADGGSRLLGLVTGWWPIKVSPGCPLTGR